MNASRRSGDVVIWRKGDTFDGGGLAGVAVVGLEPEPAILSPERSPTLKHGQARGSAKLDATQLRVLRCGKRCPGAALAVYAAARP
jgi:hypothetical protein